MKPTVWKMGGAWIWSCNNGHSGTVGDEFREDQWRDPWTACLAAAIKHEALFHSKAAPIEEHLL